MGKVVGSLFGLNTASNNSNNYYAQNILPESKSLDPEAPTLGGSNSSNTTGKDALTIDAAYTKKQSPGNYSSNSLMIQ